MILGIEYLYQYNYLNNNSKKYSCSIIIDNHTKIILSAVLKDAKTKKTKRINAF